MTIRPTPRKREKDKSDKLATTRRLLGLRESGPFADLCANCGEEGHYAAICPEDER